MAGANYIMQAKRDCACDPEDAIPEKQPLVADSTGNWGNDVHRAVVDSADTGSGTQAVPRGAQGTRHFDRLARYALPALVLGQLISTAELMMAARVRNGVAEARPHPAALTSRQALPAPVKIACDWIPAVEPSHDRAWSMPTSNGKSDLGYGQTA